ncbi:MAG: hypothetical protein KOO65_04660 [Desulfobacterales bacterium]|nr:hypothetical protein [Desulfobacterales bacterium]
MKKKSFKKLEKEFESTFGKELIPGILHNFASPLNGILGRTEFLTERTSKIHELIINNANKIDDEILDSFKKINDDIGLIAKEADRFVDLFNDVTGKFQRLCDTDLQSINLSDLIEAEMAFLEFYPDFKNTIKKSLILDRKIPQISGIKADYSISLSAIIRHSLNSMKDSEIKEFVIYTSHDDSYACIKIKDTGAPIGRKEILENLNSTGDFLHDPDEEKELFHALSLLKKYGAFFQIAHESGFNIISIRIPYLDSYREGVKDFDGL